MEEKLTQLVDEIKNRGVAPLDEAATKQVIILRLFSVLGWNTYDPSEVAPEYSVSDKRVDYSLRIAGQNKVFVEVKRVGEDLDLHQEQLLSYAFQEGIELAILTDGVSWWFYLPLCQGSWEQRKFFTIDIAQQNKEDVVTNFIKFLSRENVSSEKVMEFAEAVYKSRQKLNTIRETLPKAWNKIISETDNILIDLVNDVTEKLCGFKASNEEVVRFIDRHKTQMVIPEETIAPAPVSTSLIYTKKARKVALRELVDAGLIRDGQILYFYHIQLFEDEQAQIMAASNSLKYKGDGRTYSASKLAKNLLVKHGLTRSQHGVAGPEYWKTKGGKLLNDLNNEVRRRREGKDN